MPNKVAISVSLLLLARGLFVILFLDFAIISSADECPMFDESTPIPLDEKYLSYWIYDSERAENPYRLTYENIEDAPLHPYTTVIFMSHGYTGWKDYSPNMEVRPFYLAHTNYTVISLDWSTAAKEGCYIQAAYNVLYVGKSLAHMVDTILETREDIKCENIRFVGLSLGAHVVGNGGRNVRSCKIPRITALDAALPLFDSFFFSSFSINKDDGAFVDGYHTNCGMKGKMDQYGHVDVYMNGCVFQPGCGTNTSCSHSRSADYFGWSIVDNVCFKGYKCNSFRDYMSGMCDAPSEDNQLVRLGEYINYSLRDVYSAYSSDKPPYFPLGNPSCDSS